MKKKYKESKDKVIINLSDYFVLHKIMATANSEDQYFRRISLLLIYGISFRHKKEAIYGFFFVPKGVPFSCLRADVSYFLCCTQQMIPVYERVGVSLVDL